MYKITLFLLGALFFASCENATEDKDSSSTVSFSTVQPDTLTSKIDTLNETGKQTNQKKNESVDLEISSFLKNYKEEIYCDTSIIINSSIKISLSHKTDGEAFFIPSKFELADDNGNSIDHNIKIKRTVTNLKLFSKDTIKNEFLINSELIQNLLPSDETDLKRYGVLLLSKEIEWDGDFCKIYYSFSIPYTDLGKSFTVSLDIKKGSINYDLQ